MHTLNAVTKNKLYEQGFLLENYCNVSSSSKGSLVKYCDLYECM